MTVPDNETLPRTRAAMVEFDAGEAARWKIADSRPRDTAAARWQYAEKKAWAKVVAAFTEDTREVNTPSQAEYVAETAIRHWLGQSCGKYCGEGRGCAPNPAGAPTYTRA